MRLSDLVPEYARYYKTSLQEAAYALHELIEGLYIEHGETLEKRLSLNNIFWVEGAGSSQREVRSYSLYFQFLSKYFYDLCNSSIGIDNNLVRCYSKDAEQFKNIPASVIFFSRTALGEWLQGVSAELPSFLFYEKFERNLCKPSEEEIKVFQGKELVSIQGLARGLIEMIIEVDRAHRGVSAKIDPEGILIAAHKLGLESSSTEWYETLVALAKAVEVEDFRSNRKTLRRYVGEKL